MPAPDAYLRNRKNRHYSEANSHTVRVTESMFPLYEIDHDNNTPVPFIHNGIITLYRTSERERNERANANFYPYARPDDVVLVDKINAAISQPK